MTSLSIAPADIQRERTLLRRRRLAVLAGGWSAERPIALKSGRAVAAALRRWALPHVFIDVSPNIDRDLRRHRVNLAFLTTHGSFGEDGRLQGLLDLRGVAYTGSGVRASALAMHKPTAKTIFENAGLAVPPGRAVDARALPADPARGVPGPWVVKPASQGSAVGVELVDRASDLARAVRRVARWEREVLIERRVTGTEVTVGVLGETALPVVEIIPRHAFYDYHSKYAPGGSRHVVPARIPAASARAAQAAAVAAHRALGCRHVSRVDFIVDRRGRPWLLEVNTLPGLTDVSLLPDATRAAGLDFDGLVLRLLALARRDGPMGVLRHKGQYAS
ncbi:MAG: D-alanine--D-alanine ligase [Elusimicrobia bacterium]|nr:D-alanine--D-alanine ligase [Elusimicrobiota bacterium]